MKRHNYINEIPLINCLTNEQAEKAYNRGYAQLNNDKEGNISCVSRFVADGFYGKELSFKQWLEYYYIKII
jgi:hypothetical protein